jgi:uncharacterized damage-inducible protein DinB
MYNVSGDLLDAFKAAPDVYRTLLAGVTEEQAASAKGGDEGWSVTEVLCHMRDVEERAIERLRAIRDQNNPFLAAYDQDALARERDYASQSLRRVLDEFLALRATHISELEALLPEGWERTGMHEEQGRIAVWMQTLHLAAHDTIHAAQISRQLARR